MNQFINVAVGEKLSALRPAKQRARVTRAKQILRRAGKGASPRPDDKL